MAEKVKKEVKNPALVSAVKAVAVLVIICLVCALLLALCNDLLYVSDEERFNRSIQKVYAGFENDSSFNGALDSAYKSNPNYGEVLEVKRSTDGAYVLTVKGTVGAFNGGSVTVLVAITGNPDPKIAGWALQSNEGQTFAANITEKHQQTWFIGASVSDVQANATPNAGQGKGSGATYTENAIANAINMACYYCQNALGLGANPEGDAKKAVLALLGDDFSGYTLNTVNVSSATVDGSTKVMEALSDADNNLTYLFNGTGEHGTVFAYIYGEGDDIKIVAITESDVVTSDNVTGEEEFYANVMSYPIYTFTYGTYQAYAIISNVVSEDAVVYTVAGLKVGTLPNTYVVNVTITTNADGIGEVSAIELVSNGYVPGQPSEADTNKLLTSLVGATSATIGSLYDSNKVAGATQSANLIRVAVEAALAHYDAVLASN